MTKAIEFFLLFASLAGYGQVDTSRMTHMEPADSTEIGTPVGEAVTKEIGQQGGTIKSGDGRLELIFPVGALTQPTWVSITPTKNFAPNGTGNAYQLEPSGVHFKNPVELIFRYSREEAMVCPPNLMGFAQQNHNGKWSFLEYNKWDSLTQTLKGSIEHFSAFANQNKIQLIPNKYDLIIGDTLILRVAFRTKKRNILFNDLTLEANEAANWFVNDKLNGGGAYGSIEAMQLKGLAYGHYITPESLPDNPKVKITVNVVAFNKKQMIPTKLYATINLRDEYKVVVTDTVETRKGEGTFITDSGTFVVKISPSDIEINEVKNYFPSYFVKHKPRMGKLTVKIEQDCTGSVHIGTKAGGTILSYSQKDIPKTNDKPREILIRFNADENTVFRYDFSLPGGVKLTNQKVAIQSVPTLVYFYVNGKPQTYVLDTDVFRRYTVNVQRSPHKTFHIVF